MIKFWIYVAVVFVFVGCLIYFSLISDLQYGISFSPWIYTGALLSQTLLEFFIYETISCTIVECIIPSNVYKAVEIAFNIMRDILHRVTMAQTAFQEPRVVFNACTYFYVSHYVARHFPSLLESTIVNAYHTQSPPKALQEKIERKKRNRVISWGKNFNDISSFVLKRFDYYDHSNQRTIIHIILPLFFILTYFGSLWLAYKVLYLICTGAMLVVIYSFYRFVIRCSKYIKRRLGPEIYRMNSVASTRCQEFASNPSESLPVHFKFEVDDDSYLDAIFISFLERAHTIRNDNVNFHFAEIERKRIEQEEIDSNPYFQLMKERNLASLDELEEALKDHPYLVSYKHIVELDVIIESYEPVVQIED